MAIYILFSSIASLGFANSFFRSNANKVRQEITENYRSIKSIVFKLSLLLSPIVIFLVTRLLDKNNHSLAVMIAIIFILFSDFRIRFSFLRLCCYEGISEIPMIIVKPASIIICLLFTKNVDIFLLFVVIFVSEFACYYTQFLLGRDLGILKTFANINIFNNDFSSIDFGYGAWIFNSLNNLKTFVDLTVISILFTNSGSAEYKILTMFALLLMTVYNSSNIASSHKYASWLIDGNFDEVNLLMYKNLKRCFAIYIPFVVLLLFGINSFDLLSYFDLGRASNLGLVYICIPSFFVILLGPAPQLSIHLKETSFLNTIKASRILLSALPLCQTFNWHNITFDFLAYVLYLAIIEIFAHLLISLYLLNKYRCIPPLLYNLCD